MRNHLVFCCCALFLCLILQAEHVSTATHPDFASAQMNTFVKRKDADAGIYPDFTTTQKAAQQGNAEAQCFLGLYYLHGYGVQKDARNALQWLRKSAEQGYLDAQSNLGLMYLRGDGIMKDESQAAQWFRLAAEGGLSKAQYALGMMYAYGQGVPQDSAQAQTWLMKAAKQGHTDAKTALWQMQR